MNYFESIVGQAKAIDFLKKTINNKNSSHAYLFTGIPGIGKMLTAKAYAYTIISSSDYNANIYFTEGMHPDILIIEKNENKTVITKEQITKNLEPWLAIKPYRAKNKVAIIRDSHLLSLEAANALLKTLEEPPSYAIIILVADDNNLLETIISRCQNIRFLPIPENEILELLLRNQIKKDKAQIIARLSQGSVANAYSFAEGENYENILLNIDKIFREYMSKQHIAIFKVAEIIQKDVILYSSLMETILRDICLYQQTKKQEVVLIDKSFELLESLPNIDLDKITRVIENINHIKKYNRNNINPLLMSVKISYEIFDVFK